MEIVENSQTTTNLWLDFESVDYDLQLRWLTSHLVANRLDQPTRPQRIANLNLKFSNS